jgi:hypothetical protein
MHVQVHIVAVATPRSLLPPPSAYPYIISFRMAAIPFGLAIGVATFVGAAAGAGFHAFKRVSVSFIFEIKSVGIDGFTESYRIVSCPPWVL